MKMIMCCVCLTQPTCASRPLIKSIVSLVPPCQKSLVKPSMNVLLISLLGCLVVALPSASAQKKAKWCVTTQHELNKCKDYATKVEELECHLQPNLVDCMTAIKAGSADGVIVEDGRDVFTGGLINYDLRPIIAEKLKTESCYAVAVVKKDSNFNINELKGKTSCHSCYQRAAGWNIPIGRMMAANKITWEGPNEMHIERAVSEFFSASCVPGVPKDKAYNLCKACQGDCSCSDKEKYYGDDGALQCLKSDHGQVAFVCHNAIPVNERQNYQLLCMDGSKKNVEDYKTCNFAREPARAIIAHKDADEQYIYDVVKKTGCPLEWIVLPKATDSFLYLKEDHYKAMQALKDGNPKSSDKIRWCTIDHLETKKCDGLAVDHECLEEKSVDDCIKKIKRNEADFLAVDGAQVYIAGKCGLVPVMVEQADEKSCTEGGGGETASYYVVAVVRKDSGVTWNKLQNKKSCHTGLNRNAGWKIPDSVICGQTEGCTLYNFFSEGCAPGADAASNMCKLCKGSGKPVGDDSKCKPSAEEQYYGYDGAFRCLAEKTGDVAFIKHTVVGDYTDGNGPNWAKDLKSENFELICPSFPDTTKKYTEFKTCNLDKVPAHAVITREDARKAVVTFLTEAQDNNDNKGKIFSSADGKNLLFTDTTKCLQETSQSLEDFLGKTYIDVIEKSHKNDQSKLDLVKACTLDH